MSTDTTTAAERADAPEGDATVPPFRYSAALANQIELPWQDRWEARGHLPRAQPDRPAGRPGRTRVPARRSCSCWTCSRTRPAPACTSATRWATSAPTATPATSGWPAATCCTRWASTRSACPPSSTRCRPARTRGRPPRTNIEPLPGAAAPAGPGPRRPALGRHHRRRVLPLDPVDLPADLQLLVRRRAPARPGRSPSWSPSSPPATRPTPDGRPWAELSDVERRADRRRPPAGLRREAPVNWCPGLGTVLANEEVTADGRSERGNFPVFKRNLKQWMMRITAYADRLLDDLDRLDWPEPVKLMQRNWIGRSDRRAHRLPGATPAAGPRIRGLHHPPGHPVRRDLHGAGARARAGRRARRRAPGRRAPTGAGPAGTPPRPRRSPRYRRSRRRQDRAGAAGEQGEDRRLHRRVRRPTRSTARRSRSSSPTTCWPATAPARSWRCPARTSATGTSPRSSTCRSSAPCSRPRSFGRQGVHRATGPAINSANADLPGRPGRRRGQGGDHRLAGGQGARAGRGAPTGCATGCSAGSATGASRSRSSTTRRPADRAARVDAAGGAARGRRLLAEDLRPGRRATPSRRRRCRGRRDWVEVELDLGDGPQALPPRDQHDAAVGRLLLVRAALPGPDQRQGLLSTRRTSATGWAREPARRRLRRRRPVRRRRRARRAAPAVRPVLAQGAVRPGPRQSARSRSAGCSTRATSRRTPTPTPAASTCRRGGRRGATAAYFTATASRSTASTARWASR